MVISGILLSGFIDLLKASVIIRSMSKKHKSATAASRNPSLKKGSGPPGIEMVWIWNVAAVLVLAGIVIWLSVFLNSASAEKAADVQPAKIIEVSAAEALEKIKQGVFVLDVRTQAEYDQAHIANSTLIPLDVLKNRLNELPGGREIVLVCRSGNRSKQALSVLKWAGITDASSMAGGINAWRQAGYPLEGTAP